MPQRLAPNKVVRYHAAVPAPKMLALPADPIVNDHYGDVLWKNGNKIQARYYWNYVLKLEQAEDDLKKSIEKKLIKGL